MNRGEDRPIRYRLTALAIVELGRASADPWRDAVRAPDVPIVETVDELARAQKGGAK